MRNAKRVSSVALLVLVLLPAQAIAHHFMDDALPRTFVQGLLSGLGHPLIGIDHAAFIVAVGFLLALIPGGMLGVAALIAGTLGGALLHLGGNPMPWGETGIALSVVVAGLVLATGRRIPAGWVCMGILLAGVLHGHAYAESIFGAEAAPLGAYLLGFSLCQLAVATAALAAHRKLIAARASWSRPVSAGLGALTGVAGLMVMLAATLG